MRRLKSFFRKKLFSPVCAGEKFFECGGSADKRADIYPMLEYIMGVVIRGRLGIVGTSVSGGMLNVMFAQVWVVSGILIVVER